MTQMPAPINLDQANITKVITPSVAIGSANSTLTGGVFVSNNLTTYQPTNTITGRVIQATISGTNINFNTPVQVILNGKSGNTNINETLNFTGYGTLNFINAYTELNYVQIKVEPINSAKNACSLTLSEAHPITTSDFDGYVPVVRYSYSITNGYTLSADGYDNLVTDTNNLFSALDIGNYLLINSPSNVAGYYLINSLSADRHSVGITTTPTSSSTVPLPKFSNGKYQVLDTTEYRSGLQNGFFTFEKSLFPSQPYFLSSGFYQLNYATYLNIDFAPLNNNLFIGSNFKGTDQANAIIDQTTIYSIMLTDTRIGEVVSANGLSITKDYNSLKAPNPNANTLVSINFGNYPFVNSANTYASTNNDHIHFQSDWAVNDNFGQSLVILDQPVLVPNTGILDTTKQGTIEFWMSPLFDTGNDPNIRYYFDAYGAIVEEAVSVNNVSVKLSNPASQILSVTLAAGDPNIDYFAGGLLEIDTQNAIQEDSLSIGISSVLASQPILQVITVKIMGDFTNKDYFAGGSIGQDGKTIYLGTPLPQPNIELILTYQTTNINNEPLNTQIIRLNRRLPAQNSKVIVKYIPSGLQGDRISIYKDQYGYLNFSIIASGVDYVINAPIFWAQNTWHRVKAEYQINGGLGNDQMRLFLDGYQYTNVVFNGVPGYFPLVAGNITVGDGYGLIGSINFTDPINDLWIGTDYSNNYPIYTLLDNFRISNIFRPIYAPYGEPIDVNYSNNLSTVFPVTKDLYTTYLMDFDREVSLITNFTTLVNRDSGAFDFTINIFDSFGIVAGSAQVKQILENLIKTLTPANTQAYIKYING